MNALAGRDTLLGEYLAGATVREISARHGVAYSTLYRWISEEGIGLRRASLSRANREEKVQEKIARIAALTADAFDLRPGEIWRDSRKRHLAEARQAAFFIAAEHGIASNAIARAFEMDHSTVIHGRRRVIDRATWDADYRDRLVIAWTACTGSQA